MWRDRSSRTVWYTAAVLGGLWLLALPNPAYAYIDPGTGSMVYQALLAVLLGLAVTWRSARDWMVTTFRSLFRPKTASSQDRPDRR